MSITVENLSVSFGDKHILKDLGFQAKKSGVTAILGPNGSGKTTLLRSINRIVDPQRGSITIMGRPLSSLSQKEIAKMISYVPQRAHTCYISVFDAVLFGRIPHMGFRASQSDIDITLATIERLSLEEQSLQPLYQLSGGELQKVAIARALVQQTPIMILDEPTAALDIKNQLEILILLKDIAQTEGTKILLTIHDLNTACRFADEYIFMKAGKVITTIDRSAITSELIGDIYDIPVDIHWKDSIPTIIPKHEERFSL